MNNKRDENISKIKSIYNPDDFCVEFKANGELGIATEGYEFLEQEKERNKNIKVVNLNLELSALLFSVGREISVGSNVMTDCCYKVTNAQATRGKLVALGLVKQYLSEFDTSLLSEHEKVINMLYIASPLGKELSYFEKGFTQVCSRLYSIYKKYGIEIDKKEK